MRLTKVEFIILQIVYERKEVSGYEIDQWIAERGYRAWADIGTTSIYTGLAKLGKKRLVSSYLDTAKYGRGPLPRKFSITAAGQEVLRQEIITALSSSRERDYRFDLAIAAMGLVERKEVTAALKQRKELLAATAAHMEAVYAAQGGAALALSRRALFQHPLLCIRSEIAFVDSLLQELASGKRRTAQRWAAVPRPDPAVREAP